MGRNENVRIAAHLQPRQSSAPVRRYLSTTGQQVRIQYSGKESILDPFDSTIKYTLIYVSCGIEKRVTKTGY